MTRPIKGGDLNWKRRALMARANFFVLTTMIMFVVLSAMTNTIGQIV